jgi:hypothetical protein
MATPVCWRTPLGVTKRLKVGILPLPWESHADQFSDITAINDTIITTVSMDPGIQPFYAITAKVLRITHIFSERQQHISSLRSTIRREETVGNGFPNAFPRGKSGRHRSGRTSFNARVISPSSISSIPYEN